MEPERVSPWWYVGYLCLGITAGLAFYVLYKESQPALARRHLIMSLWLPVALWIPVYVAIVVSLGMSTGSMFP